MKVAGSIALVTGANRGLRLAFAKALVEMGATKVYAAARNPEAVTLKGRGEGQVLADEITRRVHRGLSADPPAYFQSTAAFRIASIKDVPIREGERKYHWPLGRRPDDHPSLSDLGL